MSLEINVRNNKDFMPLYNYVMNECLQNLICIKQNEYNSKLKKDFKQFYLYVSKYLKYLKELGEQKILKTIKCDFKLIDINNININSCLNIVQQFISNQINKTNLLIQ